MSHTTVLYVALRCCLAYHLITTYATATRVTDRRYGRGGSGRGGSGSWHVALAKVPHFTFWWVRPCGAAGINSLLQQAGKALSMQSSG